MDREIQSAALEIRGSQYFKPYCKHRLMHRRNVYIFYILKVRFPFAFCLSGCLFGFFFTVFCEALRLVSFLWNDPDKELIWVTQICTIKPGVIHMSNALVSVSSDCIAERCDSVERSDYGTK